MLGRVRKVPPAPRRPAPVQRRTLPDGYRRAIMAHRQAVRPSRVDPAIAEAVDRQTAAMRELSRRAFPEPDVVADAAPASIVAGAAPPPGGRKGCEGRSTGRVRTTTV
ncbi:hypothetical protein GCM10018772_18400 [Streptomyces fumanus]|uniref:Uncharacterized protein n=1 Tax=Streptomyces fumanus TaxID=67302 RepID=A0A919DYT3_9ACTN|nr:hypothetical protein GCM10018772_18400 [Streptomyces fumanus]